MSSKSKAPTSNHLIAGAASGFTSAIALQPFDLMKTRLQQIDSRSTGMGVDRLVGIARSIVDAHGWRGLWRGTNATLLRNVPGVAVYLYGLQGIRSHMTKMPQFRAPVTAVQNSVTTVLPKLSREGDLFAGAIARVTVGFLLNPFTVVKARFESDLFNYKTMGEAFRGILRKQGAVGLLSGWTPSAIRDAPYAGIFLLFYEQIKDSTERAVTRSHKQPFPGLIHSFSAATAAAIASCITHPFDVVKTKMQLRPERYTSLTNAIWIVLKEKTFFNGLALRMSRKVLSSALTWTVYEGVLLLLRDRQAAL
ncbi:mitochondrial carrier [Dacryopinax primogenitus]|uniref:Mitochondrial glycine transporter n=1 Tax=Dacryopinax primogenitus (strain DJM 731) TaxID=1858805 RepID=M5GAT5_DACPD|nr:mitochondrial carrier [Dacryopinax primogenitus]EJU05999.1 mitochondrial carrier [Dacryopinax primogenitus]